MANFKRAGLICMDGLRLCDNKRTELSKRVEEQVDQRMSPNLRIHINHGAETILVV